MPSAVKAGQLTRLLIALDHVHPGVASDSAIALKQVSDRLRRRGLIVVCSDLLDDQARVIEGLRLLRARGMEVVVFHVLDDAELTFPFDQAGTFRDVETGEEVLTHGPSARQAYLDAVEAWRAVYVAELACRRHRLPARPHERTARRDAARLAGRAREDAVVMGFLAPIFLAGLAAVAVPIVLHLFRREIAPTRAVHGGALPAEADDRAAGATPHPGSVAAAAAHRGAGAAGVGVCSPVPAAEQPTTQPPVVIAVDVSYSMGAPGRFAGAREAAGKALADLSADTPVGLVAFADRATVVAEPTTDHGAVRAQLAGLQSGHGATRYAGPLEAARGLFDNRPGRVIVVTDLQSRGWARGTTSLPDNVRLDVIGVGARVDNVLVRDLVVTRGAGAGGREQRRPGHRRAARCRWPARAAPAATQTFTLDGGVSRDVVFAGPHAGGAYVARITA